MTVHTNRAVKFVVWERKLTLSVHGADFGRGYETEISLLTEHDNATHWEMFGMFYLKDPHNIDPPQSSCCTSEPIEHMTGRGRRSAYLKPERIRVR